MFNPSPFRCPPLRARQSTPFPPVSRRLTLRI